MRCLAGLVEGVDGGLAHLEDETSLGLGDAMLLHQIDKGQGRVEG